MLEQPAHPILPAAHPIFPADFPVGWFSSAVMGSEESFPPPPFNFVVKYWNFNPPENSTAASRRSTHTSGQHAAKRKQKGDVWHRKRKNNLLWCGRILQ